MHKILDFSFWQGGESTDYIASDRIRRMLKICIPAELSYFFFLLRRSRAQLLVDPHSAWGLDRLLRAIIPGPRPRVGFTAAGTTARSPQAPVPIGRGLDSEQRRQLRPGRPPTSRAGAGVLLASIAKATDRHDRIPVTRGAFRRPAGSPNLAG